MMGDGQCPMAEHSAVVTRIDDIEKSHQVLIKTLLTIASILVIVLLAVFGGVYANLYSLNTKIDITQHEVTMNREDRKQQVSNLEKSLVQIEAKLDMLVRTNNKK